MDFTLLKYMEKLGESVISVCKRAQKGLTDAFNGCEKVENTLFDLFIF